MNNKLALLAATTLVAFSSAQAAVVYGNLGPNGTISISTSGGITLTSSAWRAIAFTPGGSDLLLSTATIGLSVNAAGSADVRLDLYSNNSGVPGTSLFNTTQTLSANTVAQPIDFTLNQTLSSGTTYWIVAQNVSGSGTLTWRPADTSPLVGPTTQNSSGWTNLGNSTGISSSNGGVTWGSTGTGASNAISLNAVPEPGAVSIAALFATGVLLRRNRRRL